MSAIRLVGPIGAAYSGRRAYEVNDGGGFRAAFSLALHWP